MRRRITRDTVKGAKPPSETGTKYVWDATLPSFGMRVYPSGKKSWVVKVKGRIRVIASLQHLPNVEEARERARGFLLEGRLPGTPRRPEHTLGELHDEYLRLYVERECKPRTQEEVKRSWKLHLLPRLGRDTPLDQIGPKELLEVHAAMKDTPVAANRAMDYAAKAFELAVAWEWIPRNPATQALVPRYEESSGERSLEPAEYGRLLQTLDLMRQVDGWSSALGACTVVAYTGCRHGEAKGLRWEWVDLDAQVIRLPEAKGDRKGRREKGRLIGMPLRLCQILREEKRLDPVWVFPKRRRKGEQGTGPVVDTTKTWAKILRVAKVKDARPKTLRHTVRTLGHKAGLDRQSLRDMLGHRTDAMSDHYYHAQEGTVVEGAEKLAQWIEGQVEN